MAREAIWTRTISSRRAPKISGWNEGFMNSRSGEKLRPQRRHRERILPREGGVTLPRASESF